METYVIPRVLIVEDDPVMQEMYRDALSIIDADFLQVYDGQEALDMLQSRKDIHVVILDLMLPSISGHQVLEHMEGNAPHPPILVVSAISPSNDPLTEIQPNKVLYVTKGDTPLSEIARSVRDYLQSKVLADEGIQPTALPE